MNTFSHFLVIVSTTVQTNKTVAAIAKFQLHIYNRYDLNYTSITWLQRIESFSFLVNRALIFPTVFFIDRLHIS